VEVKVRGGRDFSPDEQAVLVKRCVQDKHGQARVLLQENDKGNGWEKQ
jgi:hypothetical protein